CPTRRSSDLTECQVVVTDRPIDFGAGVRVLDVRDLLDPLDVENPDAPVFPVDREATIVFTSGSTGEPKGAIHSLGNHYYSAQGAGQNIALREGERWQLSLPLYHVGGLSILFRCLVAGA